jgi:myb proto-oncogene protein
MKLTGAIANTQMKKFGKKYRPDWVSVAALVPGRTRRQCHNRWRDASSPSIDRENGRTGTWTAYEDKKLRDAVTTHGTQEWVTIATLVPDRTQKQCYDRWHDYLDSSINRVIGRAGNWEEDEDII